MSDFDLTPRDLGNVTESSGAAGRKIVPKLVVVAAVVALGFLMFRTLGDAALFFYNADEAVERREELLDQRFRVQGTPFGEAVETEINRDGRAELAVIFPIRFEGTVIDVVHTGAPAELFQPGVPVVLEGTWRSGAPNGAELVADGANDNWHFESSDMVVKHDNEYRNDNRERIGDAVDGGQNVSS